MLKDYTIVTGQNVEYFETKINELLKQGYALVGNLATSAVVGKGDIITVYTQPMAKLDLTGGVECSCGCHKEVPDDSNVDNEEPTPEPEEIEEPEKELLVEPANAIKKTGGKKKK